MELEDFLNILHVFEGELNNFVVKVREKVNSYFRPVEMSFNRSSLLFDRSSGISTDQDPQIPRVETTF